MVEYCTFQVAYAGLPFKFYMGDKLREKMEGCKRDKTFFSAL
jgi:hypothetical protein